jgi:outer membrane biosynthesis protein TonB
MKRNWILPVTVAMFISSSVFAQQSDRDRGIDLYREGKFPEAISALETAVAANENDRIAWIFLGGGYVHADDETKALSAFRRSREVKQAVRPATYDRSVKVTYKPQPRYPRQARANMSTGRIQVAVEFRADGTIGFTFPIAPPSNELIPPSTEAAKGIRFEPAIKDGKPVTVINIVEYGYWIQ